MPANTDEICAAESPRAKFSSVHTGGPWYSGVRNQCRPKVYTHGEETFGYFLSFRCCAEIDGAPNELRTKKQIRDGVTWKRIERIAGFSIDEMKGALQRKDWLFNTFKPVSAVQNLTKEAMSSIATIMFQCCCG